MDQKGLFDEEEGKSGGTSLRVLRRSQRHPRRAIKIFCLV